MATYNPPTENYAIFDRNAFLNNVDSATVNNLSSYFLRFPTAQGNETLKAITVQNGATFQDTATFEDGATYNTTIPTITATMPASTDSSTKIPTTAWVQSALGGSGLSTFTITSNAVGTTSWTFNLPFATCKSVFHYFIYTDRTPSAIAKTLGGNTGSFGTINLSTAPATTGFFTCNGMAAYTPTTLTSATFVDYCGGFADNHTWTATGSAYIPNIISSWGQLPTWTITSGTSITDSGSLPGDEPCPAVASPSTYSFTYTLSVSTAVPSCSLKLVGQIVKA